MLVSLYHLSYATCTQPLTYLISCKCDSVHTMLVFTFGCKGDFKHSICIQTIILTNKICYIIIATFFLGMAKLWRGSPGYSFSFPFRFVAWLASGYSNTKLNPIRINFGFLQTQILFAILIGFGPISLQIPGT